MPPREMKEAIDAVVMMCPWFFSIMEGTNSFTIKKWAMVLTSKTFRSEASSSPIMVPRPPIPALLKRILGLPWAFRISSANVLMLEALVTSPL